MTGGVHTSVLIIKYIESTGIYGVANGDVPVEITEIGAIKVINGVVVDRVDWLCNLGRNIVPRIAQIIHITENIVMRRLMWEFVLN